MARSRQGRAAGLSGLRHNSPAGDGARSNLIATPPARTKSRADLALPAIAFVLSHVSVIVVSAANCGGENDG